MNIPTRPALPHELSVAPVLAFPPAARIPSEFQPLVAWLTAAPGRDCHLAWRAGLYTVDLGTADEIVAVGVKSELAGAVGEALRVAGSV